MQMNSVIGLITGVGIAVMVLIFVSVMGGSTYNAAEADINSIGGEVTGEVLGTADATGYLVANLSYTPVVQGSETIYANGTPITGYTIDYSTGQVTVNDTAAANATITADYKWGQYDIYNNIKTSITSSFKALNQTGKYMPLIVVAVMITIVLGLVVNIGWQTGGRFGGGAL